MGAPWTECGRRHALTAVISGLVLVLTVMLAGWTPALADSRVAAPATPAQPIDMLEPQRLAAPAEDVERARNSRVIEERPAPAASQDIQAVATAINLGLLLGDGDRDRRWDRNVRQWNADWLSYDQHRRPVLLNPYRDPVRVVYVYRGSARVVWIPPLTRIALEVADFAAYSFTAIVLDAADTAVGVAVGNFFGGGYEPGPGYADVSVRVRYSRTVYEPFRVQRIVDVGDDLVFGERKVLLDGVTPAWGVWTHSPTGERLFEIHRSQQFPGLDTPREVPLPGDYRLRQTGAGDPDDVGRVLIALAAVTTALGVGVFGWVALRR